MLKLTVWLLTIIALTLGRSYAADIGTDDASDAAYGSMWTNGSNGGTGFSAWTLAGSGTLGSSSNGFFIGSSTNNASGTLPSIDTASKAWGIYANNGNNTAAYRSFTGGSLSTGQTFNLSLDTGFIDTGASVGFTLRNGNATASYTNYNTNSQFEFLYIGSAASNSYKVVDAAGQREIGVPFTGTGLRLQFTLTTTSSYSLVVIDNANNSRRFITGNLSSSNSVDSLALYNRNAGNFAARNAFFNSLAVPSAGTNLVGSTNSWISSTGGFWDEAFRWSLNTPPSSNQTAALITNAISKTITIDSVTASNFPATMSISNLILSAPAGSTNTLSMRVGDLAAASPVPLTVDTLTIGDGGSLFISNSAIVIATSNTINNGRMVFLNNTGQLGLVSTENFTFTVTGANGSYSNVGTIAFANANNNTVLVSNGGRVDTDDLYIGFKLFGFFPLPANNDIVTVTGTNSQLNMGRLSIGEVGSSNQFIIGDGATMRVKGLLTLSSDSTSLHNLIKLLPGGTLVVGQNVFVGNSGGAQATMELTGGTSTLFSNLLAGSFLNSTGDVLVSGGQVVATNGVIGIGNAGTSASGFGVGHMTVSNATVVANAILLGSSVGGQGDLTIKTNGVVTFDSGTAGTNAVVVANDLILDGGLLQMTNGTLYCGNSHAGAMILSNGTAICQTMYVGYDYPGSMLMLTGQMTVASALTIGEKAGSTGAVWMSNGQFTMTNLSTLVGNSGVGQLTVSNGTMQASRMFVSNSANPGTLTVVGGVLNLSSNLNIGTSSQATGTTWVIGGQLLATNSTITVGSGTGVGQLTLSNGLVRAQSIIVAGNSGTLRTLTVAGGNLTLNNLFLTNTAARLSFKRGQLTATALTASNGQPVVVGDGAGPATLQLNGGVQALAAGMEVMANATVTGCGTIAGDVLVDAGGAVVADCGGTLTFTGVLTNNGVLRVSNGSVLEVLGAVVNNGLMDLLGGTTNFPGGFVNNGTVVDAASFRIANVVREGADVRVTWSSIGGRSYAVQVVDSPGYTNNFNDVGTPIVIPGASVGTTNYLDPGIATTAPARFYRIRLAQ